MKAELAKDLASCIQGEKNLNDLLSKQRDNVSKELTWVFHPSQRRRTRRKRRLSLLPPSKMINFVKEGEQDKEKGKTQVVQIGVSGGWVI